MSAMTKVVAMKTLLEWLVVVAMVGFVAVVDDDCSPIAVL